MGCGGNCACDNKGVTPDEILEATSPDGKDITKEVQANMAGGCKSGDCQQGTCEKCQTEGHECAGGEDCCKNK